MKNPISSLKFVQRLSPLLLLVSCFSRVQAESVKVPGMAAYGDPETRLQIDRNAGTVKNWGHADAPQGLLWFGELKATGSLTAAIQCELANPHANDLKLAIWPMAALKERQERIAIVSSGTVTFPEFTITKPGYYGFRLETTANTLLGNVSALELDGPAAVGAHFSKVERRNAASVHLNYAKNISKDVPEQEWFYNEATANQDPIHTFYMSCGFSRGYFGMQVNSPTERRIIFSVWDSGNEAIDRAKVNPEDRVQLLAKGEGVNAGDFGNEGTGGHSHLKYLWNTGEAQKFLLHAKPTPAGTHTIYTGFYWHPEKNAWFLIASFKAPKDGKWLRGHHSFVENFVGINGHLQRSADFGPAWAADSKGKWTELLNAGFTHDGHGKADRLDYFATPNAAETAFTLSNGGFLATPATKYGDVITRKATPEGKLPAALLALPIPPTEAEKK